jgi:hypothetical protein
MHEIVDCPATPTRSGCSVSAVSSLDRDFSAAQNRRRMLAAQGSAESIALGKDQGVVSKAR